LCSKVHKNAPTYSIYRGKSKIFRRGAPPHTSHPHPSTPSASRLRCLWYVDFHSPAPFTKFYIRPCEKFIHCWTNASLKLMLVSFWYPLPMVYRNGSGQLLKTTRPLSGGIYNLSLSSFKHKKNPGQARAAATQKKCIRGLVVN